MCSTLPGNQDAELQSESGGVGRKTRARRPGDQEAEEGEAGSREMPHPGTSNALRPKGKGI